MKNLSLKLACVFIILIFSLSPLCAMELNQDNNTKYINHYVKESNIDVEDVNIVVENQSNLKELSKEASRLSISVTPTGNPNEVLVNLKAVDDFKGTVYVDISDYDNDCWFYMHDGKGSFVVSDLTPGVHTAKAYFYGDEQFAAKNATTTFVVE